MVSGDGVLSARSRTLHRRNKTATSFWPMFCNAYKPHSLLWIVELGRLAGHEGHRHRGCKKNIPNIVSLQAYYTLAGRDLEREIAPMLLSEGVGLLVWSPLAGGFLSGKFDRDGKPAEGRRVNFDFPPLNKERAYAVIEAMRELARDIGCTVPQIAIAWLLHQKVVTNVIVCAKRIDQLSETLGSVNVSLSNDHLSALAAVTELSPEYPGWMLAFQNEYRSKLMEDQLR